jgi:methionyl aminopeptidase
MIVRTIEEREGIIEAGKRLGIILEEVMSMVTPGVSTLFLDEQSELLIGAGGDIPAFKNYTPEGAKFPYPATLCISVNDEVVHGIPSDKRILQEGDIVSLDLGLIHNGFVVDSAVTVPVGKVDYESYALMEATKGSLEKAILSARPGARIGDISYATEQAFKGTGYGVVKNLGGHGVGLHVHEEPFISNVGYPGTGAEIVSGSVFALEPIANAGKHTVVLMKDGYTFKTKDGSKSAHFEHTILIEDGETLVLTRRPSEK